MRIPSSLSRTALALAAVPVLAVAVPAAANEPEEPICGEREIFVDRLVQGFGERPASVGLGSDGNVVEVFRSAGGSWTLLITKPGGVSCVIAAGEAWHHLNAAGNKLGERKS